MKKSTKTKAPPKLSPQETIVFDALKGGRPVAVAKLYSAVKKLGKKFRGNLRRMQQHVGVLVARINRKRRRTVIVPGGDHNYILRRRR